MKTAEEILKSKESFEEDYPTVSKEDAIDAMIEFAKMHVEAALKAALDEVPYGGSDPIYYEDVKGILTCYPLENIK